MPLLKDALEELNSSAERGLGPAIFMFFLMHGHHALTSILFALNDTYDPASRWDESKVLLRLTNVPAAFPSRYREVMEGPFDDVGACQRFRLFESLAKEVLDMAEVALAEP